MGQLQQTIIFDSDITKKNVQHLIDVISQYTYVNLYFATNGGRLDMMNILIDFLNHRYEMNSIKVTLFDFVASAGTLLLVDYNGPIFVKDLRAFLFHAPDISLPSIRKDSFQKGIEKLLHKHNEEFYNHLANIGLSKTEINKIKSGEDIYYFAEDFHKLKVDFFVGEETITNHYVITKPNK